MAENGQAGNGAGQNPLGLKRIHHVEFACGNAKQSSYYYRKAFGFSQAAYSGLETGNRESARYLLKQNEINLVLTTPLTSKHVFNDQLTKHLSLIHI